MLQGLLVLDGRRALARFGGEFVGASPSHGGTDTPGVLWGKGVDKVEAGLSHLPGTTTAAQGPQPIQECAEK